MKKEIISMNKMNWWVISINAAITGCISISDFASLLVVFI